MRDGSKKVRGGARTAQERDLAALLRIQTRDTRALADLYDAYTPLLYSVVLRILGRSAEAEDALQEAWLQVWKQAVSYDPGRGTVAAWLLTVARSRALDRYRSVASRQRAEGRVEADAPTTAREDPAASSEHAHLHEKLVGALATLAAEQRQVLEMAYFGGQSQSEIAARIGAPLGTVKSWTRQGLARLRELLPSEGWS